jgi:hypothetical protein
MNNIWCFANKRNEIRLTITVLQEEDLPAAGWVPDIENRKRWMGFSKRRHTII